MSLADRIVSATITALGESDCERLGAAGLAQPVNAITSLAFSAVGVAMIGWARVATGRESWVRWGFVAAMVATGIGSFLYHGPQSAGSGLLHDVTFLTALLVLITANAAAGLGWRDSRLAWVFGASVAAVSTALVLAPTGTNVLTAAAIVGLVGSDVALFGRSGRTTRWYLTAIGLLAVAVVATVLGRTGSPLCEPGSYVQFHGAWHLLAAGALGCYAVASGRQRVRSTSAVTAGTGP